jgi:hypothetical protein
MLEDAIHVKADVVFLGYRLVGILDLNLLPPKAFPRARAIALHFRAW